MDKTNLGFELSCQSCGTVEEFNDNPCWGGEEGILRRHITARHPTYGILTDVSKEEVHKQIGMKVRRTKGGSKPV